MLRVRRYRAFLVFAAISLLVVFHLTRSRDWSLAAAVPAVYQGSSTTGVSGGSSSSHHDELISPGLYSSSPSSLPSSPSQHVASQDKFATSDKLGGANAGSGSGAGAGAGLSSSSSSSSSSDYDAFSDAPGVNPSPPKSSSKDATEGSSSKAASQQNGIGSNKATTQVDIISKPDIPDDPNQNRLHWLEPSARYPLAMEDLIPLPTSPSTPLPKLQAQFKDESLPEKLDRLERLGKVKEAFEHAWSGYKSQAMGHDEIRPVKGGYRDPFNGWGATLVDALDTLWIMDMKKEFAAAVDEVKKIDFHTGLRNDLQVFETVIRYLGGLLGAYDISKHKYPVLLEKATELADVLMGSFDTPNHMPITYLHWTREFSSKTHLASSMAVLAEIGSLSVEFTRLAQLTKQNKYYDAIARITDELEKVQNATRLPGMWPLYIDASGCQGAIQRSRDAKASGTQVQASNKQGHEPTKTVGSKKLDQRSTDLESALLKDAQPADYAKPLSASKASYSSTVHPTAAENECTEGLQSPFGRNTFGIGALADSTYEYLPKEYMLLGGVVDQYRTMYENAMDIVRKHLMYRPMVKGNRDLRFVAKVEVPEPKTAGESPHMKYLYEGAHLTCFAGGMFAVGAKLFGIDDDMDTAAKLTDGCVWAYESTASGIMPEQFTLVPCDRMDSCIWDENRYFDVLDPDEEIRKQDAEDSYQRRVQWALKQQKQLEDEEKKKASHAGLPTDIPTIPTLPTPQPGGHAARLDVRDGEPPINSAKKGQTTPTITIQDDEAVIPNGKIPMPKKLDVPSHAEYANLRIEDERLPPGFAEINSRKYILRPEAIESVFIMYRLTGDKSWREKGWKMFEAVSKHTWTEIAHSAIADVTAKKVHLLDSMESFWLAETLKYFYLLFSEPSVVSLDEYVLNTEAHPLKRPELLT